MRTIGLMATAALGLAACAPGGGNESNNMVNVAAEEGNEDLNAAVGGDELAPDAEASDDLHDNAARPAATNAAR